MKKFNVQTNRSKTYGQNKNLILQKYKEKNPQKKKCIEQVEQYPNLLSKYESIIAKSMQNSQNLKNKEILSFLEQIFSSLYCEKEDIKQFRAKYYEMLDTKYANDIEKICLGLKVHLNSGAGVYSYLSTLLNEEINNNDLEDYIKTGKLNFSEFLSLHNKANKYAFDTIERIKSRGNIERILFDRKDSTKDCFYYRIQFADDVDLKSKFQDIVDINETFHGPLVLNSKADIYPARKLKQELVKLASNDKELSFTYNIVRFLEPEKIDNYRKEHNLPFKIDALTSKDNEYDDLREFLIHSLKNTEVKSKNFKTLYKVLNNSALYSDTLQNNHARIRFVGRLILNKPCDAEVLENKTLRFAQILDDELNKRLNSGCTIFPYMNNASRGFAPSFYLGKSKLGMFVKLSLNKDAQIQTIFQDYPNKFMNPNQDQESELSQQ